MAEPLSREAKALSEALAWLLLIIVAAGTADLAGWADPADGWFWGFGSATLLVFAKAMFVQSRHREMKRWTQS